jgi:2-dehydro-3-deoxyphosphogluconate aldolase / (4S)-4-hydroxy-2-oxoglutarate aldolase
LERDLFSLDSFLSVPIVGILRNITLDELQEILPIYYEAGLKNIEITMNTPLAGSLIKYALSNYKGKLNIGAGTVYNMDLLNEALDAGASFIVSPNIDEVVIKRCKEINIPIFPGAFTPSEIYKAWEWGASMVKVYPATSVGPQYIKDIRAPFDFIKLMPTGGIDLHNIRDFLEAGAESVGIGSHLFNKRLIKEKNWSALRKHFVLFFEKLNIHGGLKG